MRAVILTRTLLALALALAAPALGAQRPAAPATRGQSLKSSFDRTVIPPPGPTPELTVPRWTRATLANGAELVVSERHALPLVSFNISFVGGANQFEPAGKTGLASFVAAMLSEGTRTRSGDELSNALQKLGTSVSASVGGESGSIGFLATRDKFAPTLDLLADMLLNPAFPADALERLRARTLVNLTQARDRTAGIAANVFPRLLYPAGHPYGAVMTEQTAKAITRDDLVAFHKAYFQPGRAVITVVGDITPAQARAAVERALAAWPAGGSKPDFAYPSVPAPRATTIYLVDKPGAAQSTMSIGLVGPPRNTPDYYALRVMNALFGELFQSRLNANIREQHGYAYGAGSGFGYGRGGRPFRMGGDIVTAKTDSALLEFLKEVRGIRGDRPPTDDELAAAKASLVQSLPSEFASVGGVAGALSSLYVQGLPEDYYQQFARAVNAVTKDDVVRVARTYVDPDHLTILVVGDRKAIEGPLTATKVAPVVLLDVEGKPIATPVTP